MINLGKDLSGRRVLLINLGRMMEVLYSIPFLNVLTANYPEAKFSYLLGYEHKEILNNAFELDRLVLYNKEGLKDINSSSNVLSKSSYLQLFTWLRKENFDYIIDLAPSLQTTLLQSLKFKTEKIKVKDSNQHLSQRYLSVLDFFAIEEEFFDAKLPGRGIEGDYIERVFNRLVPASSDALIGLIPSFKVEEDWSDKKYTQLSDWINQNLEANLILLGNERLKQRNTQIASNVQDEVIDLTDKLNFKRLEMAIDNLDLVITANPAAIYLAIAREVPVIALAGGFDTDKLSPIKVPNIVLKGSNNQLENLAVSTVGNLIPQLIK